MGGSHGSLARRKRVQSPSILTLTCAILWLGRIRLGQPLSSPFRQLYVLIPCHRLSPRFPLASVPLCPILPIATLQYFSDTSKPMNLRLSFWQARAVVPEPMKGSRTMSPSYDKSFRTLSGMSRPKAALVNGRHSALYRQTPETKSTNSLIFSLDESKYDLPGARLHRPL